MNKEKLPPLKVKVNQVKPLIFGEEYESRIILDHAIFVYQPRVLKKKTVNIIICVSD